jgi:hypothetical protein
MKALLLLLHLLLLAVPGVAGNLTRVKNETNATAPISLGSDGDPEETDGDHFAAQEEELILK